MFLLLYSPCLSTIAVIRRESGSWRWAGFSVGFSLCIAWLLALSIVTIGGISGVIQNVKEKRDVKSDDDIVVIKTGEARIEMIRSSISRVVSEDGTVATVEKK